MLSLACNGLIGIGDLGSSSHLAGGSGGGAGSAGRMALGGSSNYGGAAVSGSLGAGASLGTSPRGGSTFINTYYGGSTGIGQSGGTFVGGGMPSGGDSFGGGQSHVAPGAGAGTGSSSAVTNHASGAGGAGSSSIAHDAGVAGSPIIPDGAGSAGSPDSRGNAGSAGSSGAGGSAGTPGSIVGSASYNLVNDLQTTFDFADGVSNEDGDTSGTCWRLMRAYRLPRDRARPMERLEFDPIYDRLSSFKWCATCEELNPVVWEPEAESAPIFQLNYRSSPHYGDGVIVPPRSIDVHPGRLGEYADVVWSAPRAGRYTAEARFVGLDTRTTTDVTVIVNGVVVSNPNINGQVERWISTSSYLQQGDTIEFAVGVGSDSTYFYDSTLIEVEVRMTSP